ncbi:hypothetical protein CDD83_7177 [Cordyceps sp. RAO-2017]|nr:hypothetical protein CDD83_7177 [Cordyceps sp. RAO-2017]
MNGSMLLLAGRGAFIVPPRPDAGQQAGEEQRPGTKGAKHAHRKPGSLRTGDGQQADAAAPPQPAAPPHIEYTRRVGKRHREAASQQWTAVRARGVQRPERPGGESTACRTPWLASPRPSVPVPLGGLAGEARRPEARKLPQDAR